jgi:CubicO group peptidase (beta-lactamase class C family)
MDSQSLQNILGAAVQAGEIAGAVAAVTGPAGTLVSAAAGTTVLGAGAKLTADTVFWIASMTKPVTSLAAMQMVEAGKLALDEPLATLLPELAAPQILADDLTLRPAQTPITLRHLLTHTSGFGYPFTSKKLGDFVAAQPAVPALGTRASLRAPLLFEPGERWEYGISTDWVGLAVEAASGQSLDAYFADHIFAPLGMTDTGFLLNDDQVSRLSAVHYRLPDGSLKPAPLKAPQRPEIFSGGGGLYSTANDYLKFLRVFLNHGAPLIAPETCAAMCRNAIGNLFGGNLVTANPALLGPGMNDPTLTTKWTLAFRLFTEPGAFGRHAGSLSWAGIANTYFWIDPAVNRAAVILMQVLPAGDPACLRTCFAVEQAIYAAPH